MRALFADPRVAGALWPGELGGPLSPERADALLAADMAHWRRHGFGPWIFARRDDGVAVGRGGLAWSTIGDARHIELLYAVAAGRWGRGHATEIGQAALAFARERLPGHQIVAITRTGNLASRRVMEKAGLRFAGELEHAGLPHVLYREAPPAPPTAD